MAYTVEIKSSAKREVAALPLPARRRIDTRILALADNPRAPGCDKMHGSPDVYRVRVGDFRIVYQIRDAVLIVVVVKVGNRRDVYRRN